MKNQNTLYLLSRKFYLAFLFLISIPAKIFNFLKVLFGIMSSKLVFFYKGNNLYKNFKTDVKILKDINYKDLNIRVKINNYWDYWRIRNFESFPVDLIIKEKKNNSDEKIIFYEIGANIALKNKRNK